MTQLAEALALKRQAFNLRRGIGVVAVMLLPLIVLGVLHQERYFLSVASAALFVGLSDPGGEYGYRLPPDGPGRRGWCAADGPGIRLWRPGLALVVLAAFVVTVLAGLVVKYGLHRFTAAMLLNIWFLIALALPAAYRLDHVHTGAGPRRWPG